MSGTVHTYYLVCSQRLLSIDVSCLSLAHCDVQCLVLVARSEIVSAIVCGQ